MERHWLDGVKLPLCRRRVTLGVVTMAYHRGSLGRGDGENSSVQTLHRGWRGSSLVLNPQGPRGQSKTLELH